MAKRKLCGALLLGAGLGLILFQAYPLVCLAGHALYIAGVTVLFTEK